MSDVGLKVVLAAETQKATDGVKAFNKSLEAMPAAATKASEGVSAMGRTIAALKARLDDAKFDREGFFDPKKIAASNASIQKLEAEIKRLENSGKAGFDELGNSIEKTGSKTNALSKGFGLIRQAAFILPGIGIAGIFGAIGAAVGELISKLAEAGKSFTAMNDVIGTGAEATFKAKKKFDDFVETLNSGDLSFTAQKNALKDINKSLEDYGVQLNSVSEAQKFGAQIGAIYAEIKGEEAKQTALATLAATEYAKQAQLLFTAQQGGVIELKNAVGGFTLLKNAILNINSPAVGAITTVESLSEKTREAADNQKFFSGEIDSSRGKVAGLVEVLKALTHPLTTAAKTVIGFSDFVSKLRIDLEGLKDTQAKDPFSEITKSTEKLKLQFEELKKGKKLTADDIIDAPGIIEEINRVKTELLNVKLFDDAQKLSAKRSAEIWALTYKEGLKNALKNVVPAIPVIDAKAANDSLKLALAGIDAQMKNFGLKTTAQLQEFKDGFNNLLSSVAADAVSGIAEAIGNSLSGKKNPFAPLLSILGDGLISLGKYVIRASITLDILKKALDKLAANPALGIIVGGAMVALGTVIKSKVNQTAFATGGIVTGPTNALIGEAGPEVVFPLNKLDSFLSDRSGGSQPIVLTTAVRGSDLLLIQQRANSSFKRTNG